MAYLIDKQTVKVTDLMTGVLLATVSHTAKIDWLVSNVIPALHAIEHSQDRVLHNFCLILLVWQCYNACY